MADSSLDDFFAKKDKSKKKTKTKSAADVEDGGPKSAKKDKKKGEKTNASGGYTSLQTNTQEDEEWKDFEEAKEVDYSGLRIQTLQISREDQDRESKDGDDRGDDDDDENKDRRDGTSGPWNKSTQQAAAHTPAANKMEETPKEEATPKGPSKYIPPAQRQAAMSGSSAQKQPHSRKKKEAPNMHSEEDFPTLGGGPGKGFSQQYSSSASSDLIDNPGHRQGVNLTLENKFSALQD